MAPLSRYFTLKRFARQANIMIVSYDGTMNGRR